MIMGYSVFSKYVIDDFTHLFGGRVVVLGGLVFIVLASGQRFAGSNPAESG
jgi:hypothetical protein